MSQTNQTPPLSPVAHSEPGCDTALIAENRSAIPESADASRATRLMVLLLSGLASGVVGGLLVLQTRDFFAMVPPEGTAGNGILTEEQMAQVRAAQVQADYQNAPLALGLLGLVIAGSLGLAAGGPRRSVAGLLTGCVGGGLLGALGGISAVLVRQQLSDWDTLATSGQPDPLLTQLHVMALHLPTWLCIAVAVGIAIGVSTRPRRGIVRMAGFAAVAVLIASLIYPTLAALFFQMENPDAVIPSGSLNLILWTTLNAGLIGVILASAARPGASTQPSPELKAAT